jgi:hypothetical protein
MGQGIERIAPRCADCASSSTSGRVSIAQAATPAAENRSSQVFADSRTRTSFNAPAQAESFAILGSNVVKRGSSINSGRPITGQILAHSIPVQASTPFDPGLPDLTAIKISYRNRCPGPRPGPRCTIHSPRYRLRGTLSLGGFCRLQGALRPWR